MYRRYLAVVLVLALASGGVASATTVVYAISSLGIVVGADGKTTSDTALKIVLLKERLVVADIYTESMKASDTGALVYDFPSWIKQIDDQTDDNVSVHQLVATIKNQMPTAFAYAIGAIQSGKMTKEDAAKFGADQYLVQYVIAGYEKGVPLVYSLTLMPDWDTKTVKGPFQVLLKKGEPQNAGLYYGWRGRGIAIAPIRTADTEEQREFDARIKPERKIINSGKSLTTGHLSNVVRVLLEMEATANPRYVGLPFTVVSIPKIGSGSIVTYQ